MKINTQLNQHFVLKYFLVKICRGLLVIILVYGAACKEDFDIVVSSPPKAVVYGLFNPMDSISYIRLTKTFSGQQSFSDLAKLPDYLYFDSAGVSIDINSPEGYPITSYYFKREVLPDRGDGLFLTTPNFYYCLKGPIDLFLSDGFQLRLIVRIPGERKIISAQQIYYAPPVIQSPRISSQTRLSLYHGEAPRIKWEDKFGFCKYKLIIRLNYLDRFKDFNLPMIIEMTYTMDSQILSPDQENGSILHIFDGDGFLKKIGNSIALNSELINRSFVSLDIIVSCQSRDFCNYDETNIIATDRMGQPVSNIVGGLGLFALQVQTKQAGYLLDPTSLDSLVNGRHTKHLKFVKW